MGSEADYTQTSHAHGEASPDRELTETTTPEATSGDITTIVTQVTMTTFRGTAILIADVDAAAAANPTTRASAKDHATIAKATSLDARRKPEAHKEAIEEKTKVYNMSTQIDKP